jgi:hypothetical protein
MAYNLEIVKQRPVPWCQPCGLVGGYRRFRGVYRLHLQVLASATTDKFTGVNVSDLWSSAVSCNRCAGARFYVYRMCSEGIVYLYAIEM